MRIALLIGFIIPSLLAAQNNSRTEVLLLMGSRFEITAFAPADSMVENGISVAIAEIKRIESLISEWSASSQVSEVNSNAGIKPVVVSEELFNLIFRCKKVSQLTDGAFDISWAGAGKLWKFDGSMKSLPRQSQIDSILPLINYQNIILDNSNHSVFLKEKGMKIGFGAIGKGYAANMARNRMKAVGIESGVVICGGDLITWGVPALGKKWIIGIANPDNPTSALAWLEVGEMGVVTSGDYEKFVVFNGKRYCHIINPKSGYPAEGLRSVSIFCPDAELADALATGVFVLGKERGLQLINQLNGVECMMIDTAGQIVTSKGLNLNYYKQNEVQQNHAITVGN